METGTWHWSETSLNLARSLAVFTAIAAPISTAAASIASVGLLIFWVFSGQMVETARLAWRQPVGRMIVLFTTWLIVGMFYADTDWPTRLETFSSWKKLLFAFVLLGIYQSQHWQRRFVYVYTSAMALAGIAAIILWALDIVVRNGGGPGIFMTNYATQSTAFVAALLCCIFIFKISASQYQRYFTLAGISIFTVNIFFVSPSRSGYLAVPIAVTFAFGIIYGFKKLPKIIGVTAIGLLIVALTSSTAQQRLTLALEEQANYQNSQELTSVGIRMVFYENTLDLIKQAPLLGYGTSSFKQTYSRYAIEESQGWQAGSTSDPHNQYLFVWLENGLVGLVLFLAYIYIALRQGIQNRPYGPIAASFLIAICTSSLFNSHFKTFAEGYLIALFLGSLLSTNSL